MAEAHRKADEAAELVRLAGGGGAGCGELKSPQPSLVGLIYGGADVLAWAWIGMPDQAVAVQFLDQDGTATWQQTADRIVIFLTRLSLMMIVGVASLPSTRTVS